MAGELRILSDVLLLAGLVALGTGFLWRDRRAHLSRSLGWAVFSVFWLAQVPSYASSDDLLNVLGSVGAFVVFLYLAWHERLSYKWDDEYEPLRFVAGAAFIATAVYFLFDRVPQLSAWLIESVAHQTASLLSLLNAHYSVGPADLVGNPPFYRVNGEEIYAPLLNSSGSPVVQIILACTAIQGIAIAAAIILGVKEPRRKRAIAFAVVVPATYLMNLVRNVVVIYFFDVQRMQFELVHGYYGKALAVLVLVVLLVFSFKLLPELYVNINGLFELPWRKGPGHDYRRFVGRIYKGKDRGGGPTSAPPSSEQNAASPPGDSGDARRRSP